VKKGAVVLSEEKATFGERSRALTPIKASGVHNSSFSTTTDRILSAGSIAFSTMSSSQTDVSLKFLQNDPQLVNEV
jgi:hypothetical protein